MHTDAPEPRRPGRIRQAVARRPFTAICGLLLAACTLGIGTASADVTGASGSAGTPGPNAASLPPGVPVIATQSLTAAQRAAVLTVQVAAAALPVTPAGMTQAEAGATLAQDRAAVQPSVDAVIASGQDAAIYMMEAAGETSPSA